MKSLLLISFTLLTLSSNAQTNKKNDSIPPPLTTLTVTLKLSEWQTIINALQELPAKIANPITDAITKEYYIKSQPKKKP